MNNNIEVVNENLWVFNFHYVKMGYIKELSILNHGSETTFAALSNDGKFLINKSLDCSGYIPFFKAVMSLDSTELGSKGGFCKVIRQIAPNTKNMTDKQIIRFVWEDSTITGNWTIYENICKWEFERRKVQKQYIKKHWLSVGINKLLKRMGVKK